MNETEQTPRGQHIEVVECCIRDCKNKIINIEEDLKFWQEEIKKHQRNLKILRSKK